MSQLSRISEPDEDKEPSWWSRKILAWVVVGGVVAGVAGSLGVVVGYPAFRHWRQERLLNAARAYLRENDYRRAELLLEQSAQIDPQNYAARRMLAGFYETVGSPLAMQVWAGLVAAEPDNAVNLQGLAAAALRLGALDKAGEALRQLQAKQPDDIEYHRLAAGLALLVRDGAGLERHLAALARFQPDNLQTRFSLAAVRLFSAQPVEQEQARVVLTELARGETFRIRATLALINDAPRRWPDETHAVKRTMRLAISILRRPGLGPVESRAINLVGPGDANRGLSALVAHMQTQPHPEPADVATLAQWMLTVGQARELAVWLASLPETMQQTPAVLSARTSCAVALGQWSTLETLLLGGAWGPLPPDVLRDAFALRAALPAGQVAPLGSAWKNLLLRAQGSLPALRALQQLAQLWHWPEQRAQALWAIVQNHAGEPWAWQALAQYALQNHDAALLWRVYNAWAVATPQNLQLQLERLIIGLLLRPAEPGLTGRAAEMFQAHPASNMARVAQALALWREKKPAAALALLDAGRIDYQNEPRFALVRGLILSAAGHPAESEAMLVLAVGQPLLPEEAELVAAARRRNLSGP